jgi:hypothetical protein
LVARSGPNSASASVTAGKLAGAPSSAANSSASAATQMSMPAYRQQPRAKAIVQRAGERRNHAQHHRKDGQPQARGKGRIAVGAHQDERHQEEQSEQRRVAHEPGDIAAGERAFPEQREIV